jgi:AcrR family transcriptional regulator
VTADAPDSWPAEPLPRGRHKLSRETVRDSQRARLLRAMLEVVAEHGYAATTVSQVAAAARVSPNRFYSFFSDKADCFLSLCDEQADELLGLLGALGTEDWPASVREGMRIYLQWWCERPEASRAYLVELPIAGEEAGVRRDAVHERYVALFAAIGARARELDPSLPPLSRAALRVLVAGTTELVAAEVRAGRLPQLPELQDDLVAMVIAVVAS